MNRDIIERSASYNLLSEYLGKPKNTIKSDFRRCSLDIKNPYDVGHYIDKNLLSRGGVYCIENIVTKKRYVGQSRDMFQRTKQHMYSLNTGNHVNKEMQKDYKDYGRKSIIIYSLCFEENKKEREKKEKKFIKSFGLENLYNSDGQNRWETYRLISKYYDKVKDFVFQLEKTSG